MDLEIIYQDEFLAAVNKPHGMLTHRSKLAKDAKVFALQSLRDQLGRRVSPLHRLDRKTGGVLMFGLSDDCASAMQQKFVDNQIKKTYWAVVRGYTPDSGHIDYPLANESGKKQEAVTDFKTLRRTEIPLPFGRFETSRYSLVEVYPQTGRMHQIRKHFAHLRHPIIADRPHGCNKQNKLFLEKWDMDTMLLHAKEVSFEHPFIQEQCKIQAPLQVEFKRMLEVLFGGGD